MEKVDHQQTGNQGSAAESVAWKARKHNKESHLGQFPSGFNADGLGFEPRVPARVQQFSRLPPSSTRPPIQCLSYGQLTTAQLRSRSLAVNDVATESESGRGFQTPTVHLSQQTPSHRERSLTNRENAARRLVTRDEARRFEGCSRSCCAEVSFRTAAPRAICLGLPGWGRFFHFRNAQLRSGDVGMGLRSRQPSPMRVRVRRGR